MVRIVANWGYVPIVLVVLGVGILVSRVIEAGALAAVLFAAWTVVRRWVPS